MEFRAANGRLHPGFRFHPTDVELVVHYLKRKVLGKRLEPEVVAEVDIYQFHPEDLRQKSCLKKDLNWYFFCARGKKYGSGDRTNRATHCGYWKATGNDRVVLYQQRAVGKVKTLVFHVGKPPKGERTDWVMHEYKLEDNNLRNMGVCQDAYVLCKIFKKSGWGPKNGEHYGAPYIEEEWDDEEEMANHAPMVPAADQDQSPSVLTNSAVINGSVSVDACPPHASEHVCFGAGSVSAVDQAPTPMSDAAQIAVDQASTPMSDVAYITSKHAAPEYNDAFDHEAVPISKAADIASTSKDPIMNNNDDCPDGLLFHPDDFGIFDSLEDLGFDCSDLGFDWSDLIPPL